MAETGSIDALSFWLVIACLGAGTFTLRYAPFLLYRDAGDASRAAPRWLRFVPAAVLPALTAPMALLDAGGAWRSDPAELAAIAVACGVGVATRNTLATIVAGMGALWSIDAILAL